MKRQTHVINENYTSSVPSSTFFLSSISTHSSLYFSSSSSSSSSTSSSGSFSSINSNFYISSDPALNLDIDTIGFALIAYELSAVLAIIFFLFN
jgi:hypothetical protein